MPNVFQTGDGRWFSGPDDDFEQDEFLLQQGVVRTRTGYIQVPRDRIPSYLSMLREPEPPMQIERPKSHFEESGVSIGDYGRLVMSGGAQLAQGAGWLARSVGLEDIGSAIETLGRDAVDYWHSGLSEEMKDAMARDFIVKNEETGEYEFGDFNIHTIGGVAAQSLLGTAAGAGVGGGISKVLQLFANPVGRSVLVQTAQNGMKAVSAAQAGNVAAQRAVQMGVEAGKRLAIVDKVIGAVGFGAGEGAIGGLSTGVNVYDRVMRMPPDKLTENPRYMEIYNSTDTRMSELERHQYAADTVAREASTTAGFQSGLTTALLGAPMGAFFGGLLGKKALGALAKSVPRAGVTGALGEAAQEFAQGGVEQTLANRQVQQIDPSVDVAEGVLNEAVGGALAGGLMGGALGTMDTQPAKPSAKLAETGRAQPDARLRSEADTAVAAGVPQKEVDEILSGEDQLLVKLQKLRKRAAGVPAEPAAMVADDIPQYEGLSDEDRKIERSFAERIAADPDAMEREYSALDGTMGGKMLNADIARELSPDYLANRTKSAPVQEPSTFLMKRMFDKALASEPKEGDLPHVVFTAGGTGAGKTSSLSAALEDDPELSKTQVFVDSNMAKAKTAIPKIDKALDAGKEVTILYTFRDPTDAMINGVIPRAKKQSAVYGSGRTMAMEVHLQTHLGSFNSIREIAEHYKDDPRVHIKVVNNSQGRGKARVVPLLSLPEMGYDETRSKVNAAIDEAYAAGEVPDAIYRAITGRAPQAFQPTGDGGRASAQSSEGREQKAAAVSPKVLFETVPSKSTRAGAAISGLPFERRQEFSRRAAAAIDFDTLAEATGMPKGSKAEAGRGMWQGQPNPSLVESVAGENVPRETVERMARAIQYVHQQDEVLWYRPDESDGDSQAKIESGTHAPTAYIELTHELSSDEQAEFDAAFQEAFGELSYTAAGNQVISLDFSGQGPAAWEERLQRFNALAQERGLPINLDASTVFIAETGSVKHDWSQADAAGQASAGALLQAATGGSSAAQESLLRSRQAVERLEAEYAGEEVAEPALLSRKPLPKGIEHVAKHLTADERAKLRANSAERLLELFDQLPPTDEFVAAAKAGAPKRGWYKQSGAALRTVFGDVDAPRFTALLAALSPQTDVASNLYNALNTWVNWVEAGRPTDRATIVKIMGKSVQGSGDESSVLGAWINNAVRALATTDPVKIVLSGPKVNSFMLNLLGNLQEVTNDAWMANFALVDQALFSGRLNVAGTDPGKVAGYLAMNAKIRAAASALGWEPAEVQETIWSWAKTAYETADAKGELRTVEQLVKDNAISEAAITATPDFGSMFANDRSVRQILEKAGYADAIQAIEAAIAGSAQQSGEPARATGTADARESKALVKAARRLDALRKQREGQTGVTVEKATAQARAKAFSIRESRTTEGQAVRQVHERLAKQIVAIEPLVRVEILEDPTQFGLPEDAEGWMRDDGTVVLFAENLPPGREQEVFTHEVFGHIAMERTTFGKQSVDMLLKMRNHKTIAPLWDEVRVRWGVLDEVTHAKEVIAVMAERGSKHAVMARLISGVRSFLRKLGIVRDYNESDVRALIARAARALRVDVRAAMERSEKLRALTPESTDADILAAIDEAIPPGVVEVDRHLDKQLLSRAAPADPVIQALIDAKLSKAPEEFTLRDKIRRWRHERMSFDATSVKQGLIDSFASIEKLEREFNNGDLLDASQSAYKAALATKYSADVFAATMVAGVPDFVDGAYVVVPGRKGIIEIFDPLTKHKDGNLLRQWELYAAAVRANRLIKETNPDGTSREKLFTQAEINEALKLDQKYPEFKTVLREWNAFNKQVLDLAQEAGIIDPMARAVWEKNDYVPFYRAAEEAEQRPRGRRGIANQRSDIKSLKGEDKALGNVFENMMLNTAHLIDASIKNRAMQKAVGLGLGTALEPVPMDWMPVKFSAEQLARALEKAGVVPAGQGTSIVASMTPQQRQQWVTLFRRMAPKGQDIVSVMVNGKPEYYRVTDPLVLSSLTGMGRDTFSGILNLLRGPKKLLTTAISADPAFMLANAIRDTLSTWVLTPGLSPRPMLEAIRGAKAALMGDQVVLDMMMAGAVGGGFYDTNPEEMRKLIASKLPKGSRSPSQFVADTPGKLWNAWRKVGSASEQMNRVARFREVLRAGGTVAEAAYQARDVLNFRKSGDYEAMRWLVQSVPFLNARVQGLYKLYRGARDNRKAFFIKGAMLMAATLALAARNDDDERYNELQDWQKDAYWWFFFDDPDSTPIAIPKPFEVGAMFATLPERIARMASGRDSPKLVMERVTAMFADTFAFNPIPQAFKPLIEQYANRTFYFGTPIVGAAEQKLQPEAQFDAWTSETMRALAEAMPGFAPEWMRSPQRLEAAMRGYTGTLGMYALSASDSIVRQALGYPDEPARKLHDLPVVRRFIKDPNPRSTRYTNLMYEMMDETNALYSTINRYRREHRFDEAKKLAEENRTKLALRVRLNRWGTQIRNINNQIRLIQISRSLSPTEKRERIDVLVERKNQITRKVAGYEDLF